MKIAIIGTGLIGGSLALALKQQGHSIIGVENNPEHAAQALALQLVDEIETPEKAIDAAQLIILSVPVDIAAGLLPFILDRIGNKVVMDVGSTKEMIVETASRHVKRGRFVATHPMGGTEYSGPAAAVNGAFVDKACVICDREATDADALGLVEQMYLALGMHLV